MNDDIPIDAYVLIIGAMKCGTTSLFKFLKKVPEICRPIVKEPEFFSENQGHGVTVEKYADLWQFDKKVHRYALEASTGYSKYPHEPRVAENIVNYGIKPKFIYIIRNPFERIVSHYNSLHSMPGWWRDIDDEHLINVSNYFMQLERYRKYFPLEDMLILDFGDLRDHPATVIQSTYDFLDLQRQSSPTELPAKNINRRSVLEARIGESTLGPMLEGAPKRLRKIGRRLARRVSPRIEKRVLTRAQHEAVYEKLAKDMGRLHEVYGVDVRRWGFDA